MASQSSVNILEPSHITNPFPHLLSLPHIFFVGSTWVIVSLSHTRTYLNASLPALNFLTCHLDLLNLRQTLTGKEEQQDLTINLIKAYRALPFAGLIFTEQTTNSGHYFIWHTFTLGRPPAQIYNKSAQTGGMGGP